MKKKIGSSVVYIISFFVVILAFCAFAVDATFVYTTRGKLQNATETAALAGASGFGSLAGAEDTARSTFDAFKVGDLAQANVDDIEITGTDRVKVTCSCLCPPFFLGFLGVKGILLKAEALAVTEKLTARATYTNINWITSAAAYISDVISNPNANGDGPVGVGTGANNYNDTAILRPIGNYESGSVDSSTGVMRFDYLDEDGGKPLSLGPSGFITIKLPAPIIDKPGADLFIKEIGHSLEGYFVFVGLDANPERSTDNSVAKGPYIQYNRTGEGIRWKNISCTGKPEVDDGNVGAYPALVGGAFGTQTKFYGSGSFDIGANCSDGTTGVAMAKYIRIIDDNDESAFVSDSGPTSGPFYKAMMTGESSTPTSGADIDYVQVLNHVRLLKQVH